MLILVVVCLSLLYYLIYFSFFSKNQSAKIFSLTVLRRLVIAVFYKAWGVVYPLTSFFISFFDILVKLGLVSKQRMSFNPSIVKRLVSSSLKLGEDGFISVSFTNKQGKTVIIKVRREDLDNFKSLKDFKELKKNLGFSLIKNVTLSKLRNLV